MKIYATITDNSTNHTTIEIEWPGCEKRDREELREDLTDFFSGYSREPVDVDFEDERN